jgi:hypothetical protein
MKTIALITLVVLIATVVALVTGAGLLVNSGLVILTVVMLGVYTHGHFHNNRLDLFDHQKGVKLTNTQMRIVSILEYKIPAMILGFVVLIFAVLKLIFVVSVILLIPAIVYYLFTH